jgi:hypothetical protein
MRQLIETCWAPSPDNRPTFTEVLQVLHEILSQGVSGDAHFA